MEVRVELGDERFPGDAFVDFYPTFSEEGTLVEVPAKVSVQQWAIWNESAQPRNLLNPTLQHLDSLFPGPAFQPVSGGEGLRFFRCASDYQTLVDATDTRFLHVTFTLTDVLPDDCLCCE